MALAEFFRMKTAWENPFGGKPLFTLKDEFIHFYSSHAELLAQHGLEIGLISREIIEKPI